MNLLRMTKSLPELLKMLQEAKPVAKRSPNGSVSACSGSLEQKRGP